MTKPLLPIAMAALCMAAGPAFASHSFCAVLAKGVSSAVVRESARADARPVVWVRKSDSLSINYIEHCREEDGCDDTETWSAVDGVSSLPGLPMSKVRPGWIKSRLIRRIPCIDWEWLEPPEPPAPAVLAQGDDRCDDEALGRVTWACTRIIDSKRTKPEQLAEALAIRGSRHEGRGAFDLALKDYSRAIALNTKNLRDINALLYRGRLYMTLHKYDLAIADFTRQIDFGRDEAHYFRAWAFTELGNYEAAIADLKVLLGDEARVSDRSGYLGYNELTRRVRDLESRLAEQREKPAKQ